MKTLRNLRILGPLGFLILALASCKVQPAGTPQANLPNPASVYCQEQGYQLEIVTAADGSQSGECLFPDGSRCDEWAFFRGECAPAGHAVASPTPTPEAAAPTTGPTDIPTPLPIDPQDYTGWQTYTHPGDHFSLMLPEDWTVEEVSSSDPLLSGHALFLHPSYESAKEQIRVTFRRAGEDTHLWPTGVGQGEFVVQGTLEIAGEPAQRLLLVCPTGEITALWYHQAEGEPNITRGSLEFGFIFSYGSHCEAGLSLGGKVQRVGEMIIASLAVP